jgi:hypothetical protein
MNSKRIIAAVMVAAMGMSTTACNENTGFASPGTNDSALNGGIEDIDTASLDADLDEVEKAMADVQSEVSNISVFGMQSASTAQSKSIDQTLDEGIRKAFDALISGVDKAKAKAAELRAKVNVNLAKLDPLNPLHIMLVMKLQEIMTYLDRMDAEISAAVSRVVTLVNDKVADLDAKIAALDPKNPLSIIAMIYWAKLKATILECNAKLATRI